MKKSFFFSVFSCLLLASFSSYAQFNNLREGVQSFQQERDAWRRQDTTEIKVLQNMRDSLGNAAVLNVTDAEQVFCYQVENRSADYSGYTLNGFAVTGFCGIINDNLKNVLVTQFLTNADNFDFTTSEQCVIRPKLMIRFVRGVDMTDVLISAPCYSVAFYYAGKVKAYNFKPGGELLDTMVTSFDAQKRDFISPTLLNQMLPIGVPQTVEQQQLVRKNSQPIRNWEMAKTPEKNSASSQSTKKETTHGWNKLKVNIK